MIIFTNQIEKATVKNKQELILGDANLCSEKWNEEKFKYKLSFNSFEVQLKGILSWLNILDRIYWQVRTTFGLKVVICGNLVPTNNSDK